MTKCAKAPGNTYTRLLVSANDCELATILEAPVRLAWKVPLEIVPVADGTPIPWRVRLRSSSFCNLSVAPEICRGFLIADIPAIIGSLDIVLGEIDR